MRPAQSSTLDQRGAVLDRGLKFANFPSGPLHRVFVGEAAKLLEDVLFRRSADGKQPFEPTENDEHFPGVLIEPAVLFGAGRAAGAG